MTYSISQPRVGIVGGGLAGLAAAVALCDHGCHVEVFEERRQLGGRAGSYHDPTTGQLVDHCQHIGMGCCTNLADFCRRTGIEQLFRRDRVLYFIDPNGSTFEFSGAWWLPAPLHLAPSLLRLGYLSWSERLGVARALLRMAHVTGDEATGEMTIGQWLNQAGQSQKVIDQFWSVVLVSALGEKVENSSFTVARKVFVDGFMTSRRAYEIQVPTVSLGDLYDKHVAIWLTEQGARIHRSVAVDALVGDATASAGVRLADGSQREFQYVVVAVPWRRLPSLARELTGTLPELERAARLESSPITSIHLWFDRPICRLPHAVLIDRLTQWVFYRGSIAGTSGLDEIGHHYQVVISASHELSDRDRDDVLREVRDDLESAWPQTAQAHLLRWRIVTQPDAVFAPSPGAHTLRPAQQSAIPNLMLAGDWTQTGWPSTMESAVRSGYLATERILQLEGRPASILAADLPQNWLSRLIVKSPLG